MWQILKEFGIPRKLIKMIEICTHNSKSKVKLGNKMTEPFQTVSGLRQGCILSPLLFSFAMEKITRTILNRPEGMIINNNINNNIKDLSYADDIDLIAPTLEDLGNMASDLNEMASRIGLSINENKTKLMKITKGDDQNNNVVVVGGLNVAYVNEFKYLGSIVTSKNEIEKEIKSRITSGNKCYYSLINLFKKRSINIKTKCKIYTTVVRPVALYGCETWTLTKKLEKKLLVFENAILRRIAGPVYDAENNTWRRRHNEELREITQVPLITNVIKTQRLRWAGHTNRMNEERYPKKILLGEVGGRRHRGRPRKRWVDCIREDVTELGERGESWLEISQDRQRWGGLCRAALGHGAREPPE